jgi:hypothetical protein
MQELKKRYIFRHIAKRTNLLFCNSYYSPFEPFLNCKKKIKLKPSRTEAIFSSFLAIPHNILMSSGNKECKSWKGVSSKMEKTKERWCVGGDLGFFFPSSGTLPLYSAEQRQHRESGAEKGV